MQRFLPTAILVCVLSSCQAVSPQIPSSQAAAVPTMVSTATSLPAMTNPQSSPEAATDQPQEMDISQELRKADELIKQGEFADAILILNAVLAKAPDNLDALILRATAYTRSNSNNYETQLGYDVSALQDIDKMIMLEPTKGDNYVNRDYALRTLAGLPPDRATKFALYELANESAEKAIALGVTSDFEYIYRHHARNLIESNHCEEGLDETKTLVDKTSPEDPIMGTYNIYLTEAYLCIGDFEKALKAVQKVQCSDVTEICKTSLLAPVYYQSGELEKALMVLDDSINAEPNYEGWRYFLRALIYYEQGKQDQAIQDLATGKRYTWFVTGSGWYVSAKIAFDNGDDIAGMSYLQNAESGLEPLFEPLRQRVLAEIEERGGEPLIVLPQIPPGVNPTPNK